MTISLGIDKTMDDIRTVIIYVHQVIVNIPDEQKEGTTYLLTIQSHSLNARFHVCFHLR